eukprot:jgi/Astpho2/8222/e_gw1.00122.50.1_t
MNPQASGLGGGTIMVIRAPNGTTEVIDAREVAPAAATQDMFKGRPEAAINGGLAVAVPLELKGLWLAHQRHGSKLWADLVARVVPLAEDGFPMHPNLRRTVGDDNYLDQWPDIRAIYKKQSPDGSWRTPAVNETCCQRPQLAESLRQIAITGPDAVYGQQAAEALAAEIQANGGIITAEDLQFAQPVVKEPLLAEVFGQTLIVPPLPSSAATIILALHILEGYVAPLGGPNSLGSHHVAEAMKHAFALRMQLGDPEPGTESTALMDALSPSFAAELRATINDSRTQDYHVYGGKYEVHNIGNDSGTSHLTVIDELRGAVSMTTTVNTGFGSKVISKSTGLLLNNQMDDFSTPQQANAYDVEPSVANYIRPGKKPLSSMSPSILQDLQGNLLGTVGASGGPLILTSVFQTLIRLLLMGADPLQAIASPRLHSQLLPDVVGAEAHSILGANFYVPGTTIEVSNLAGRPVGEKTQNILPCCLQGLVLRGHDVRQGSYGAVVQAISCDPAHGVLIGASDPRKDGAPAGY